MTASVVLVLLLRLLLKNTQTQKRTHALRAIPYQKNKYRTTQWVRIPRMWNSGVSLKQILILGSCVPPMNSKNLQTFVKTKNH